MRQPKEVHIFLFRIGKNGYEYGVFQRSDMSYCWQGVCGGVEDNETLEEAARRELFEEACIDGKFPLYRLESISYLPDTIVSRKQRALWGKKVVVIPMYFFAMPFNGEIKLSKEHTAIQWLPYQEAYDLIYFLDQKIALYELNEKLERNLLIQERGVQ